ncbi:hypothetical protein BB558_000125 [Smittium angustum]|uniref:Aquaporin n=1 Tax=Smittium angustum TaxID=133377 RepID=A0A2U1JFJ8_SMIAN|nr:hypothetical protein BB558_000125 [Smittium angustum]
MDPYFKDLSPWYSDFRVGLIELIGTLVYTTFGYSIYIAAYIQTAALATPGTKHSGFLNLIVAFGWCIGATLALFLPVGVYRVHLNPVITIANAIYRRYPVRRIPIMLICQFVGSFMGFMLAYSVYSLKFKSAQTLAQQVNPGNVSKVFLEFVLPKFLVTSSTTPFSIEHLPTMNLDGIDQTCSFLTNFFGGFILVLGLFAITDKRQLLFRPIVPVSFGLFLISLYLSLGTKTNTLFNPTTDLAAFLASKILIQPDATSSTNTLGFPVLDYVIAPVSFVVMPILGGIVGGLMFAMVRAPRADFELASDLERANPKESGYSS